MQQTPAEFRGQIAHHNRHAVLGAFFSFAGALGSWGLFYIVFAGAILGFVTVTRGDAQDQTTLAAPHWLHPSAAALCGVILACGIVDHRVRRYRPVSDRPVIGWHLVAEVLLTPARLTIAIFSNLASMILLTPLEKYEAWRLLWIIHQEKRLNISEVGLHTVIPKVAPKLLGALQLVGWIDLHHNDDDWYYMVCSDREEEVRSVLGVALEEGGDSDEASDKSLE